ncbi:MAG: hypothetical protein GY701_20595 [Sulfitobacter sp.]|nr:hypothetical protein [Sulfitobacter sp.]
MERFWIGLPYGQPPHWDGRKRSCVLVGKVELATGGVGLRVKISPPLVELGGGFAPLTEGIVTARFAGDLVVDALLQPTQVRVCREVVALAGRSRYDDGDLEIMTNADAAPSSDLIPDEPNHERDWARVLADIRQFTEQRGHSRFPEAYEGNSGRLDYLVSSLRFFHAPWEPGTRRYNPFPGVDWERDLDALPGWEWEPDE